MAILRSSSSPSPLPLSDCGATEKDLSMCVPGGSKPSSSGKSEGFAAKKKRNKEKIVEKGKASEDDRVVKRVRKCAALDSDSEDELDMDIFNGAKLWEYYFKPEDKFIGKITFYPNSKVDFIEVIKKKLTSEQLVLFRETCFGHFLDMSTVSMQAQLIHASLYREVHQNNEREIWFRFRNDIVIFSVAEFGLISGLKCTGDMDYSKYANNTNEFAERYFYDQTVTYGGVESRFLSRNFKDDGFAVKMVVLYFVTNCLLSKGKDKKVHAGFLILIGSGEFNSYPWGKLSYDYTFHGLRVGLKSKQMQKKRDLDIKEKEKDLLDLSEFEWYGLSVSDDDFVGPAMPKKVVKGKTSGVQNMSEKVAKDVLEGVSNSILKDMKDSLAVISDHQKTIIDTRLLEFKKTIEENFLEFEKFIKSYIDCKIEDGLKVYLDMRFEVLKNLIAGRSESVAYDDFSGDDTDEDFDPETKDDKKVKEQDTAVTENIVVHSENVDANIDVASEVVGGENNILKKEIVGVAADSNIAQLFNDNAPMEFDDGGQVGDKGGDDAGVADKKAMGRQATDDSITPFVMDIINEKMDDIEKDKSNEKDKVLVVEPIQSFGSPSAGVSKEIREIKGQFEFSSGLMDVPLCVRQDAFDEWNNKFLKRYHYTEKSFDFVVAKINHKMWFYDLLTPGRNMSCSHIDVLFYYLRKKIKYDQSIKLKDNTTDCYFATQIFELKDIDMSKGLFRGKREYDPLDIFIVQGLPQQTHSDCGIFIFKYSEYFAHGLIEDIPNPLDVKFVRNKICVELFVHGMAK
uniref:Ubiquitin-like protease family profile domain-containing protein n=1 Tax=Cannabis sativa TaxID=3483 RepID=A0A803PLH1_CANSA